MSPELIFLLTGAVAGGFVNGLAGFGTSLFALGWWLLVMSPLEAVAMVLLMAVLSGIQGMILVRRSINWNRLLRFLVPALLGIPIGLHLLDSINPVILKLLVGCFLVLYGGFFIIRRNLPAITRQTDILDMVIGFCSGILGAIGGLSGVLPTMWCSMRPWPKDQQRALLQPFNMIILAISAVLLAFKGGYSTGVLWNLLIVIPISILTSIVGIEVFKRLQDEQFRRLLIALMLVSGLILLGHELILV